MKDEYFVGVYKKADSRGEPANKTKWDENIYDDMIVTKDIDEANEFALKYNAKGYYVMFEWKSVEGYGSGDDYYEDEEYDYCIYKPYEMSDVASEVDLDDEDIEESLDEAVATASLMTLKNQLMQKLGNAFSVIGGGTVPKVTIYPNDDPGEQFEVTTDGKNVDVLPKHDGMPDTANKKRGIAFMRAANVVYDFIMKLLGLRESMKLYVREGIDRNDEAYFNYDEKDFEIADALLNCGFEESGFTTNGIEYVKGYSFDDDTGIYCVVELPSRLSGIPRLRQYDEDSYEDVKNTSGIREFNNEHDVYQFCGWFAREYDIEQ